MAKYDRPIATAANQIMRKGAICVWTETTMAAPEPETKHIPGDPTPVTHDVVIALFPYTSENRQVLSLVDTDVPNGSLYGIMAQVDFTPTVTATVAHPDGSDYRVLGLRPLDPAGEGPIIYEMVLTH